MSKIIMLNPSANSPVQPPLDDATAAQQAELRYLKAVNALIADATENGAPRVLADALTWGLASMIIHFGSAAVVGDILGLLGTNISRAAERQEAQKQAAKETEEGRAPH